jgi:hypothetical protein
MNLHIDNSAFQLLHCKRRFQLTVIEGRRAEPGDVLNMGNAIHVMLEHLDKGSSVEDAIKLIRERYPKIDHAKVIAAVTVYKSTDKSPPPIELASGPAVEVKFKYPYASVLTPSGEKVDVDLVGTMDRIYLRDDWLIFRDYKSGLASTDYQVDKSMAEYDLAFQLPFYVFCMKNSGTLPAVYKDYIENHRYRTEIHYLYYNFQVPKIKRRDWQPFNSDFIDREVPYIINAKIREAIEVASLNIPAPHDGMNVYKACGYCPFKPACLSMGTDREIEYLNRFETTPYDPLSFR